MKNVLTVTYKVREEDVPSELRVYDLLDYSDSEFTEKFTAKIRGENTQTL